MSLLKHGFLGEFAHLHRRLIRFWDVLVFVRRMKSSVISQGVGSQTWSYDKNEFDT